MYRLLIYTFLFCSFIASLQSQDCNHSRTRTQNIFIPDLAFTLTPKNVTDNSAVSFLSEAGRRNFRFNGTYGINNSNIPLAILNLWYETDIHGKVVGTPQLFFTGLSFLQTWTQLIISAILFSQNGYTSTFSLGGTTLYGINLYGQTIGWTNSSKYIIKISMDSNFGEDGKVSITAEQN